MKQGEIWLVNLDPTVGAEIKKTRRAIIISVDDLGKLPLKIIAPITEWKEHYADYPWMVKITPSERNCLSKISAIDCFQVKSVSVERFTEKIGSVESEIITKVHEAVNIVIGSI
jgi:mRNA interferase MazF